LHAPQSLLPVITITSMMFLFVKVAFESAF